MRHILTWKNKEFKEKTDEFLSTQYYGKTPEHTRKTIKHKITCAIAMIMFYKNSKSNILKVLGFVVYWFIEKYVCVDYLSLQIEAKLLLLHRAFEDNSFDEISGIVITQFLLNIVSYYGYNQDNNSTLILTCRSKLVSYYLWKGFVRIEKSYQALKNFPQIVKNCITAINMYENDSTMSWCNPIHLVTNNLKNIYLGGPLCD